MNPTPPAPCPCGGLATVSPAPTFWAVALAAWGVLSAVGGAIGGLITFLKSDAIATAVTALQSTALFAGYSLFGIAVFLAMVSAAIITAALVIAWAWQSYSALCGPPPPPGMKQCVTGVINTVQAGFTYWYSQVVGFSNNQPRIDVVVKSRYWAVVCFRNPAMVWCASCANCPPSLVPFGGGDPPCSPMLPCYYHNAQVCGAAKGSAIGATVGAVLGAIGGVVAGVLAFGAFACSFTAAFTLPCLGALFIIVVSIVVTVVITALIGSAIGTQIGKAAAGGSSLPTGASLTAPQTPVTLTPGTYVSVVGNMVNARQSLGANVLWFAGWIPNQSGTSVDDQTASNGNGTMVLGVIPNKVPPFCFTDLDDPATGIPDSLDKCPLMSP